MLMQIGQKPENDFNEPIGMLEDCHKRILHFMQTLVALAGSVGTAPLNADDRDALERSLFYFKNAGPRHTADEEEFLFPQLRGHLDAQNERIFEQLASLEGDHRWAETQHFEIDVIGRRWLSTGILHFSDHARLRPIVHSLWRFYAHHIEIEVEIEEKDVFPAARRILSDAERNTVGPQTAERRGIRWPHGPGMLP